MPGASSKKFALKSKTVHANILMVLAVELFPSVKAWVAGHPNTAMEAAAMLNILMRKVSSEALSLVPKRFRR